MEKALFHEGIDNSSRIIYTPSSFAKSCFLHIQEIGSLQAYDVHISQRSHLDSYLLLVVVSGSGSLTYNDQIYSLSSGDCAFIDCNKPYSHKTSENLWSLKWIHFNGPTMKHIYEKYVERGGLPAFSSNLFHEYNNIWDKLYSIASGSDGIRDTRINEGLSTLISILMQDSYDISHKKVVSKRNIIIDIQKNLEKNFSKKITLDELAERYYINKFYLTHIFKGTTGVSINEYLLQIRISHAKQLLRFSDKGLDDIGTLCGIGNIYYFSRTFKKSEGISPNEYRNQWNTQANKS